MLPSLLRHCWLADRNDVRPVRSPSAGIPKGVPNERTLPGPLGLTDSDYQKCWLNETDSVCVSRWVSVCVCVGCGVWSVCVCVGGVMCG